MDEDFDLCISETNLPFPYSDHCSTGPPSLHEFDEDEEEDEDEYEEGEEHESGEEEDEDFEDEVVVRKETLVDADSEEDPSLTVAPHGVRRTSSATRLSDFPRQLQHRLESIQNKELKRDTSTGPRHRPRFNQRTYSYDSEAGWHEEEEVQEDIPHVQPRQEEDQQDKGVIPTVTSAMTSIAYTVGKYWSKVYFCNCASI